MGGKSKQSQRTKNNARPSSSGRSAELLNNAMNLESWNSPGGGKMAALFPTLNSPIIDPGLSPEFSVCVKKLNKKDPITKTKALQELTELVNNSNVDDVAAALPSWAHFYKILAVDTDCKVREATQACHAAVARVCGRRLAPALRRLVPAWLQAQHDDHAPAQALAANSLKATFPENKLPEVISFCKEEVVAHLLENLTGTMDKTILNRIEDPEERVLQQTRLVASSLRGLRGLARLLPPAQRAWLHAQLQPLLAAHAFWKLANHQEPQVRAAWFGAMGSMLEALGGELGAAGPRVARLLLAAAPAAPPAVAHQLWGCLLALMYSVPDWHKWLDKKDLLTKRILDLLESGGWGDARRLSELLLPLLAHLPPETLTKEFYEQFFNAFFKGLDKKSILSSKSERQYWITSLSECLRYLSIQPQDFVAEVTSAAHRAWLRAALAPRDAQLRNHLVKHSAASMAALAKFWLKQSREPGGDKYDQLLRNFWQNVASTVLAQIDQSADKDAITKVIDGHILLLQTLKSSFLNEKKPLSIKFDDDAPAQAEKPAPAQEIDPASVERYKHNLSDVVEKTCCGYFDFADKKDLTEAILTPLITILNEFDARSLYVALATHFEAGGAYELYEKVLRRWMLTDTTRCKPVVEVIFILLKHLSEDEQDAVLASFDQFPCGALEWCVWRALGGAAGAGGARARRWLRGAAVERALLALARRLLRHPSPEDKNLLFVCLSHDSLTGHGEMMISESTASGIAHEVATALGEQLSAPPPGPSLDLEHVATVAAHLATALAAQPAPPADDNYHTLVLNLFELIVLVPRGSPRLSSDTWGEVRSGAHDGVTAVPAARRPQLLAALAAAARRRLAQLTDTVSISEIVHITSLCPGLLLDEAGALDADCAMVRHFSQHLLATPQDDVTLRVEVCALRWDCISGDLNCPIDDTEAMKIIIKEADSEEATELTKEDFVTYANRLLFRAVYLRTMLMHKKNDDDSDVDESVTEDDVSQDDKSDSKDDEKVNEGEEKKETAETAPAPRGDEYMVNEFLRKDYFEDEFCNLLYAYAVVDSLKKAYGFWVHYNLIHETHAELSRTIAAVASNSCDEVRRVVLLGLARRAAAGYYWAYAKAAFEASVGLPAVEQPAPPKFNIDAECLSGNGFFHSLQADVSRLEQDSPARTQVEFALLMRCALLAHGAPPAHALRAVEHADLDPVIAMFHQHQDKTLYEKSIADLSWQAALAEAAAARCATRALRRGGWDAPAHHWDFATVGLCTLMEAVRNAQPKYASTKVNIILHATINLYKFVHEFVSNILAESERRQPQPHVLQLVSEWRDVFAPALHRDLYLIAVDLLEFVSNILAESERRQPQPHVLQLVSEWRDVFAPALHRDLYLIAVDLLENGSMNITSGFARTVRAVADAVRVAEWGAVEAAHRGGSMALARLVRVAAGALARPLHPAYHCLAYTLLLQLARPLADYSEEQLAAWSAGGSEEGEARARPELAPDWFQPHLTHAADLAAAALEGHTAGEDSVEMVAGSDAHAVVLGALLLAEALHQTCALARGELQHHHIQAYRENKYTESLLPTALRLVPAELLALTLQPHCPALPAAYADHFQTPPSAPADDAAWWRMVGRCACRCVSTSAGGSGAGGARGWWGAAGRAGRPLARLLAAYVTPALVRRQLELLVARKHELEDTEVTVHWSSNEAAIVYRVEDRPVELWVRFESDFPLSLPRVTAPTVRPAVTTSWIAMFIAYQNGTVLAAVKMWSAAISSQVESSPQCYVCYCRLHPATGHLPQVRCHQCRNRFHTACIHKWFVSSHRSNCPLCRSNF